MKVIIAGTRTLEDPAIVRAAMESFLSTHGKPTEIVHGGAPGADELGKYWADAHGVPVKSFYARWGAFGRSAGPKRNKEMANYADALVALWDGASVGTANMIANMRTLRKLVVVWRY